MIKQFLTKEVIMAVLRHVLGFGGGILMAKGFASTDQIKTLSDFAMSNSTWGAVAVLIAISKSVIQKFEQKKQITDLVMTQGGTIASAATPPASSYPRSAGGVALILLGLFLAFPALAQTSLSTNPPPGLTVPGLSLGGILPTNIATAANDILPMVEQIVPYLTNITGASVDFDGIYSSGNRLGGILALNVSVPGATNYLSLGVAGEYVGTGFYVAPVDAKLGITYNVPLLNIPAYSFIGTGLSMRVRDSATGDQTLIGEAVVVNLGKNWYLAGDGGRLFLTQTGAPGSSWFGGARVGKNFNPVVHLLNP
jgi:hypothetical protein